jgi:tripeptide aminopeptidase
MDPLVHLFLSAVKVDALSLKEQSMARFVHEALDGLPIRIEEDATASVISGNCGNLICIPPSFDPTRPSIALFAHLDTPRSTAGVTPVLTNGRITSDGSTILGVDNRAGVSVLLHALRHQPDSSGNRNFIVVFTVAEEIGLLGSKHVDLSPYNVKMGFVFDCSKRPGTFIQSAVGCSLYTATFRGRASHAAVAPEKGVSAIRIAAKAIAGIPMGRLSPTMTTNVGTIRGGEATNVVADRCVVEGEVREFDGGLIHRHLVELEQAFRSAAAEGGGDVEFSTADDFPPFVLDEKSPVFQWTVDVLNAVGLTPHPIRYLGGSDANMLNAKGIPTVNLGIGAQNPHGNDEFILLEDLRTSFDIARILIERSSCID